MRPALSLLVCLLALLNATPASAQTLKIIEYNIQNAMQHDEWQDYAEFVNWVRLQDPDILVLCEGRTIRNSHGDKVAPGERSFPERLKEFARSWGHGWTAVSATDKLYPVLVTSRYPIEKVLTLKDRDLYAHSGLYLRVAGLNLVAFQGKETYPGSWKLASGYKEKMETDEPLRVKEMTELSARTIANPEYAGEKNWVLTGTLGGMSYADSLVYNMRHIPARFDAMRAAARYWPHDIVAERLQHAQPGGLSDYGLTSAGTPNRKMESTLFYGRGRVDYFLCDGPAQQLVEQVRMIRDPFTFRASDHLPLEVVMRLPEGVQPAARGKAQKTWDVAYAGKGEVPPGCLKLIDYNIQYGMVLDQQNHYDNFVAWVRAQAPDILTLCEGRSDYLDDGRRNPSFQPAFLPDSLASLARRWGHPYVFVGAYQDDHPVLVTSKYPIEAISRLEGPRYKHGGLHVKVCGIHVVATHTTPFNGKSKDGKSGPEYRRDELKTAVEQTLLNPAFKKEKYWVLTGDLNSVSSADAEYYRRYNIRRSYLEQDYLRSVFDHDVIYDWNKRQYQPTVRHGRGRIDFLYTDRALYKLVVSARTIVDGFTDQMSDHLPVEMVFKAPKGFKPTNQ